MTSHDLIYLTLLPKSISQSINGSKYEIYVLNSHTDMIRGDSIFMLTCTAILLLITFS